MRLGKTRPWPRPLAAARSLAAALLGAAALVLLAGCAFTEALRGLPPFFEATFDEPSDTTDVVLRPLFRWRDQPKRVEGSEKGHFEFHYLYPLGRTLIRPGMVEHRLHPIFYWVDRKDAEGFVATDRFLFPFVFWGSDPGEGAYFSLWPLGGTLRSLLAKDYILHILFPLFAYTRLGELESYQVLFPFFAWHTGRGNSGFRIFPLIGHQRQERDGVLLSDRWSILFPLIAWERDNVNSKNPFTAFAVFPLYGETRSKLVDETTVLWPFFRKREEKKDGIVRWRAPFPFCMLASGNETEYDFWPFVGYRRRASFRRIFALWPLIRHEIYSGGEYDERRVALLPIVWSMERRSKTTGEVTWAQRRLWPLAGLDRGPRGSYTFRVPALLWFKDGPEGNFEEILTPVTELCRVRRRPDGARELKLLFGAFSAGWSEDGHERGWSLLGGLAGWRTTREGDGRVRVLWFVEF